MAAHSHIHARARTATIALVAALVGACALAAPAPAAAAPGAAQLRADQRALEARVDREQRAIAQAQAQLDELQRQWEQAQLRYVDHVVTVYREGQPRTASLLASRGLADAIARAQLVSQVGSYQRGLVRDIERADARAEAVRERRDQLALQVQRSYAELDDVRRAISEQAREARTRAQRRRSRARAAAAAPKTTAFTQLASFAQPASPAPAASGLGSLAAFGQGVFSSSATASGIDAYLAAKGSPLAGSGTSFVLSGARWGIDARLIVAIAGAESRFGAVTCAPFNAWGWGCPTRPFRFGSWAEGFDTVASGLRRNYLDEGRTSVVAIHQKYAPLGAANDPLGLNSHWTRNVTKFLLEQGGNPGWVGATPTAAAATADVGTVVETVADDA